MKDKSTPCISVKLIANFSLISTLVISTVMNIYLYRQVNTLEKVAYVLLDENKELNLKLNSKLWSHRK